MKLLKKLTNALGAPCHEGSVRKIIMDELENYPVDFYVDAVGNLVAHRKPEHKKDNQLTVVMDAHMDEPSFIVTKIYDDGLIGFFDHGGPDENCIANQNMRIGKNAVNAIIIKPTPDCTDHFKMRLDIGARSKEEAQKYVKIGDPVYYHSPFTPTINNYYLGKAFDDRAGCYVATQMLKEKTDLDLYAVFTVQEEVGVRGAKAAPNIKADINICFEGTGTAYISGIHKRLANTFPGEGPVIFIQDSLMMQNHALRRYIYNSADKRNIKYGFRSMPVGGADAGIWFTRNNGIPSIVLGVAHYNCHVAGALMAGDDARGLIELSKAVLSDLDNDGKNWMLAIKEETE